MPGSASFRTLVLSAAVLAYELEHRPFARDSYRRIASVPETGAPVAYGWMGLKWSFATKIALGRPLA